jgi:hypothetical protein
VLHARLVFGCEVSFAHGLNIELMIALIHHRYFFLHKRDEILKGDNAFAVHKHSLFRVNVSLVYNLKKGRSSAILKEVKEDRSSRRWPLDPELIEHL